MGSLTYSLNLLEIYGDHKSTELNVSAGGGESRRENGMTMENKYFDIGKYLTPQFSLFAILAEVRHSDLAGGES